MSESINQIKLPLHVFIIHKADFPFSCCFLMHLLLTTKEAYDYIFSCKQLKHHREIPISPCQLSLQPYPMPFSIPVLSPRRELHHWFVCLQTSYASTDIYDYVGKHKALCSFKIICIPIYILFCNLLSA